LKTKPKSFKLKLWLYFVLFTAIIFSVLWLLQTVFFQSFYNAMLINNTKEAAEKIISRSGEEGINDYIDQLTHDNNILVFITDEEGKLLYSSDAFNEPHNKMRRSDGKPDKVMIPENTGTGEMRLDFLRMLPERYDSFLDKLKQSENGTAEYSTESLYVYGTYIEYYHQTSRAVLYVSTSIDTVGPSVTIISIQLVWVTVLSVLIGFVLSWFIARRFARPVDNLTEKAGLLGEEAYRADFKKGFCSELDELSAVLDSTNEKLIQAKDFQLELMANVSHDLRTPLTMIRGYAEMVQDISWNDEQQCKSDLAVIIRETDRLTALVNEILEYSELKTEEKCQESDPVDISGMLERICETFEILYKPEGLTVEKSILSGITVMGSTARLERAVYNLLDNAVRHTGDSKKVKVSLTEEGQQAVIAVTDYGSGISAEEQEHIWDRYYTSRQRGGKGTSGLGLAIVKEIVELHGGQCRVHSQQGEGSSFMIILQKAGHQ